MKAKQLPRRKKWLIAGGIVLLILAILAGAFFWYVSDYYRAEDVALEVMTQDNGISVQDNLTILSPSHPTDTAIIFYPGAKVEAEAYLPLLDQIRQTGVTCILVHMPFHMAIFDANAAEDVMAQFPPALVYRRALHGRRYGIQICLGASGPGRWTHPDGGLHLWRLSG